jgi:hypothetical protein
MTETVEAQNVLHYYAMRITESRVVEGGNQVQLVIDKDGLNILITVPRLVYEWYVDAHESSAGLKAEDWYDYAGYGEPGRTDFGRDMAADLSSFLEGVATRYLRMRRVDAKNAKGVLEWQREGGWQQAVPMRTP